MYYTEKEATNFFEENYQTIFDNNKNLSLLYTEKIEEDKYLLKSNLNISSRKNLNDYDLVLSKQFKNFHIINERGSNFHPISSRSLSLIESGDAIRNIIRKEVAGSIGFIFTIKGSFEYYLVTNYHVIGRKFRYNDIIQKIISKNKFLNIGRYFSGEINENIDIAIAKLNMNRSFNEINSLDINFNLLDKDLITINSIPQVIKSNHAYAKVHDNYFYKPYKILKNQVLTNKKMSSGDSGSLVYDKLNKASGLLFAINSNFSLINKFSPIIDYISKKLNTTPKNITIINQINF